jgi:chromosome segregation ATPase
MKRDFLKNLGIEDKEIIDKILDENSADIGRAKGELETYKTKVTDLEADIQSKDAEIDKLQKTNGDVAELNKKIEQLESDNTKLTNDLNNQTTALKKTHAIENGVRDAKAKNVKAVMALLDLDKITFENDELGGLSEQLEGLKGDENSSFLFGDNTPPAGTKPNTPPSNGGGNPPTSTTLAEAVAKAIGNNNK